MPALAQVIRRTFWLACLCLLVAAPRASAGPSVVADFDGDGQRDHATVERHEPSVLRVWLSTTRAILVLHATSPILGMAARDLDGDRRDELIAGVSSGLQVWTARRKGFKPLHPRPVQARAFRSPTRGTLAEGSRDAPPAVLPDSVAPLMLTLTPRLRGPSTVLTGFAPRSTDTAISIRLAAPFGPRPPPVPL
jgi:hypothetical protein